MMYIGSGIGAIQDSLEGRMRDYRKIRNKTRGWELAHKGSSHAKSAWPEEDAWFGMEVEETWFALGRVQLTETRVEKCAPEKHLLLVNHR